MTTKKATNPYYLVSDGYGVAVFLALVTPAVWCAFTEEVFACSVLRGAASRVDEV